MTPTGVITGVPVTPGNSNFQVAAMDFANPPGCDTSDLGILVQTSPYDAGGLLGYLGRIANPGCILGTVGTVLGQGPTGAC
jgi:hypothetical protein